MMTKNKTAAKKTEDQSVVYKVPAAFALMVLVVYGFWKLGSYYATMAGFSALYPVFTVTRFVFLALFAVLTILGVVTDPTTAGVGDSKQAMEYDKPKCDK